MGKRETETIPIASIGLVDEPEQRDDGWYQKARVQLVGAPTAETVDSDLGPYPHKGDLEKLTKHEAGELYAIYVDGAWEGISDPSTKGDGDLADAKESTRKAAARAEPGTSAAALPANAEAPTSTWSTQKDATGTAVVDKKAAQDMPIKKAAPKK
jgi:hypothetical protein